MASSRNLNSIQEFSGGGAYKEWLQTFRSQCGTLSTAYRKILSGSRLDERDIRPFLPPWTVDGTYADETTMLHTASQMITEMIDRVNTDVQDRLYNLIISITKGEARNLCLQSTIGVSVSYRVPFRTTVFKRKNIIKILL